MKRNIDKLKELQHELGRYKKKQADDATLIRSLRQEREQASGALREMSAATDSVLGMLCTIYGTLLPDGTLEIRLPLVSCRRILQKYEVHSTWGKDNDSIVVTAAPRKGAGDEQK